MRRPELGEMNAFVAVAEQRSFAKAALQLGISRSRLSETISGLEARLGVRLLNRTTRSVATTAAGERLLASLRPLLDDFAGALDSINAFRDKPSGLLRLTVPPPVATLMLAPLLARFLAQYPTIELEISVDAALTDIVAGRFDAGMRAGERLERDMIALRIGKEMEGVIVAAPDYLARHPRPTTPQDLEAHNCIRLRFPSGAIVPWQFEKRGKKVELVPEGSLTINDPNSQCGRRWMASVCCTPASAMLHRRSRLDGLFLYWRIGGCPRLQSFSTFPAGVRCRRRCRLSSIS